MSTTSKAITRSQLWTAHSPKRLTRSSDHELAFLGTRPRGAHAFANRADLRRWVFRRARLLLPALTKATRIQGNWLLARDSRRSRFLRRSLFRIGVKQRDDRWH